MPAHKGILNALEQPKSLLILACGWAVDGIQVNAVAPTVLAYREPHEVDAAVVFLALPCASYITGECIAVDGGFLRFGF